MAVLFAQQNRSIARPGLPIMVIQVTLAAEEYGKIVSAGAFMVPEKLSTNSRRMIQT